MSARSNVLGALASVLAAITPGGGVGYVNTPSAVKRVQFFPTEQDLDSSLSTIFLIRVEREAHKLGPETCSAEGVLETYIMVVQRFTQPTENPFLEATAVRCLAVDDLIDDVKEALIRNPKLKSGGPGTETAIDVLSQGLIVERDFYAPAWAGAEIRIGIRYRYTTPAGGGGNPR